MKHINTLVAFFFLILLGGSCSEETHSPIENDKTSPGPISNAIVENLPGAAKITYTVPSDDDLLYVLASYVNKKGETVDFRSSYYTNNITVEGFGDTDNYSINLYAVDRSENKSVPVQVTATPLTPPVTLTAQSLEIVPDFGGITFTFQNEAKADLAIFVCTPDSLGEMTIAETFYTARESAKFSVRGFESELRKFGLVIRDKWENFSDTVFTEVIPVYEVMLDKSKFQEVLLPTDADATYWDGAIRNIWDGANNDKALHTGNASSTEPKHITFDTGVLAQLSRMNVQTTADDKHIYNDVSPRIYEIWGCEEPDPSGSFDGWTLLASVENIKPSGLPVGVLTEDDRVAARIGDEIDIPLDMPKVRYIRIRCLLNWSGNTNMVIDEVTLWGDDKQ